MHFGNVTMLQKFIYRQSTLIKLMFRYEGNVRIENVVRFNANGKRNTSWSFGAQPVKMIFATEIYKDIWDWLREVDLSRYHR